MRRRQGKTLSTLKIINGTVVDSLINDISILCFWCSGLIIVIMSAYVWVHLDHLSLLKEGYKLNVL